MNLQDKEIYFSIITICKNDFINLKETILSVSSQYYNFTNYEHIIVDGNSIDETKEYIFTNKTTNLFFISDEDNGMYDAMNKGISASNGKFLLFLNAGDTLFSDDILLKVYHKSISTNTKIFFGKTFYLNSKIIKLPNPFNFNKFSHLNACHQSIIYHNECFKNYKYPENYGIGGDSIHMMKIFESYKYRNEYLDLVIANFKGGGISETMKQNFIYKINIQSKIACFQLNKYGFFGVFKFFVFKLYRKYIFEETIYN